MSIGAGLSGGYGETSSRSRGWSASDRSIPAQTIGEALIRGYGNFQDNKNRTQSIEYQGGGLTGLTMEQMDFYNALLKGAGYEGQLDQQLGVSPELMGQTNANLLARSSGQAPILSPEEMALLDQFYSAERSRGMEDIAEAARQAAGARGMSVSDSPIGNSMLSEMRKFQEGLTSKRAGTALQMRGSNDALYSDLSKFQSSLAQQAFQNRLNLAGGQPGLGLPFWQGLSNQRLGSVAKETTNTSNRTSGSSWNVAGQVSGSYGCWVAAALYGFGTPEFCAARRFIMDRWQGKVADAVRALYLRVGIPAAWAVEHVPGVAGLLRPLFNIAVRKGR